MRGMKLEELRTFSWQKLIDPLLLYLTCHVLFQEFASWRNLNSEESHDCQEVWQEAKTRLSKSKVKSGLNNLFHNADLLLETQAKTVK